MLPHKSLFFPASFFLVRTPLFPIEEFFNLLEVSNVEDYLLHLFQTRPKLREAIAIASFPLYETLLLIISENKKEDIKKRGKAISSLFKYVLRMATRATPFGLFSFVSMGTWNQIPIAKFNLTLIKKRARPDMEWLLYEFDRILTNSLNLSFFPIKKTLFFTNPWAESFFLFQEKQRNITNKYLFVQIP